eukprot:scaffold4111_cov269-Prasinococcus_capsulatus_cf.AAC.1
MPPERHPRPWPHRAARRAHISARNEMECSHKSKHPSAPRMPTAAAKSTGLLTSEVRQRFTEGHSLVTPAAR